MQRQFLLQCRRLMNAGDRFGVEAFSNAASAAPNKNTSTVVGELIATASPILGAPIQTGISVCAPGNTVDCISLMAG